MTLSQGNVSLPYTKKKEGEGGSSIKGKRERAPINFVDNQNDNNAGNVNFKT